MKIKSSPQIKVCGLTSVSEAVGCADLGVEAIGCVFFPKSPRHLSDTKAREICRAVSNRVQTVGVFVNETFDAIMRKVEACGLSAVQLHGSESPKLVRRLRRENMMVIKALFMDGAPDFEAARNYDASAFLLECSKGPLPGGNAATWDWGKAKALRIHQPLILAGGLSAQNISSALAAAQPDAVDISSGVESAPGRKDLGKVRDFIEAVATDTSSGEIITPLFPVG